MKKYSFPVEIHTHTEHSDGSFTPHELIEAAKEFGYQGIILTDHNTSSGYHEMEKSGLAEDEDFIILKGMEWTTYFGHMLVHNANYDVDWREATPRNIDIYMKEVKEAGGLVGIAHPFDMGSPICTGCHWDFTVEDYHLVDYIEVWNSNHPHTRESSRAAFEMWLDLLNRGYQLSASAGRDWHRYDTSDAIMAVTYVETDDNKLTKDDFIHSLANGQFYISLGPTCSFTVSDERDRHYFSGDRVSLSETELSTIQATIQPAKLEWFKKFDVNDVAFKVFNNDQLLAISEFQGSLTEPLVVNHTINSPLVKGYLRYELTGKIGDSPETRLIIGNPIYIH